MTSLPGINDVATADEIEAMRLAIALSARGIGTTSPNPPVGCVILDEAGQVLGTGYHRRKGEPHAEAYALEEAGDRANGGTAVVTLEPCNHVGRTPACRQLLLDAGVARVVVAVIDPTSRGEGGAAVLRAAGVDVEVGVLAKEAELVLGPWLAALKNGRPVVTAIYVAGTDTGEAVDAQILAGLRTSVDAVLRTDGAVEEAVVDSHGQGILELPTEPVAGTPEEVLKLLHAAGVRSLLLLGDKISVEAYAEAGCVERAMVYQPASTDRLRSASVFSCGLVLDGFRLAAVTKTAGGVLLETVA